MFKGPQVFTLAHKLHMTVTIAGLFPFILGPLPGSSLTLPPKSEKAPREKKWLAVLYFFFRMLLSLLIFSLIEASWLLQLSDTFKIKDFCHLP